MHRIFLLMFLLLLLACQPEPDNFKLYDELVVLTNYDTSIDDFGSYTTYAIATDTIGFYSNQTNDTILIHNPSNPNSLPRPILTQIRANMDQRNFQQVDRRENPDIGINVYIVNDLNFFQQVIYPNFYYPYYYGYNPYAYYNYPYISTYSSNTATLIIEIVDLINRTPNNEVKVIWNAYLGDLITTVDRLKQVQEGIDQAFEQSPYLTR